MNYWNTWKTHTKLGFYRELGLFRQDCWIFFSRRLKTKSAQTRNDSIASPKEKIVDADTSTDWSSVKLSITCYTLRERRCSHSMRDSTSVVMSQDDQICSFVYFIRRSRSLIFFKFSNRTSKLRNWTFSDDGEPVFFESASVVSSTDFLKSFWKSAEIKLCSMIKRLKENSSELSWFWAIRIDAGT